MFLHILQASYDGQSHLISNLTTSQAFLMVIIVGIAGMVVQWRLRSVVSKYSKVPLPQGLTGAQIARQMLEAHGIYNVTITHTGGYLTDHFNPVSMTVNLSDDVYYSRSITAVSVAAHECGHAVQHATGYAPVRLRSRLVPLVNFSSSIATWVILIGIALMSVTGSSLLCWLGIALIAMSAIFAVVTLPVEYNASYRALAWLQTNGMVDSRDISSAREALMWAARTYLVAALSAIATLLYYVAIVTRRR